MTTDSIDLEALDRVARAAEPLDGEYDRSTPDELAAIEAFNETFDPPTALKLLALARSREQPEGWDISDDDLVTLEQIGSWCAAATTPHDQKERRDQFRRLIRFQSKYAALPAPPTKPGEEG